MKRSLFNKKEKVRHPEAKQVKKGVGYQNTLTINNSAPWTINGWYKSWPGVVHLRKKVSAKKNLKKTKTALAN